MLLLGPLAFVSPWMLTALAALPVLWWLLRVTPPAPRRLVFPPIRLLAALRPSEETPARTPLWLILLRIFLALLLILALAHPLLNPGSRLAGAGPLILVVDDGWAAAPHWEARETAMAAYINQAEREARPIVVLATAPVGAGEPVQASGLVPAAEARRIARAIKPKPWGVDRKAALAALEAVTIEGSGQAVWLSDGLGDNDALALAERLQSLGSLEVLSDSDLSLAHLIAPPVAEGDNLVVSVMRAPAKSETVLWLRAIAGDGRLLARERLTFARGEQTARKALALPGELRNALVRLEIEGEVGAGTVFLVDERWRRRPTGLVSGETVESAQPLLSDIYYLERALRPYSEVRRGAIADLLKRELAVLVVADIGKLMEADERKLGTWIDAGGLLIRFAGPRLAQTTTGLIPVRLRGGGRALGGAMSWTKPARLMPFDKTSPFWGLTVPEDILIHRQVLAEPSVDLAGKTWARLSDGTPLITAEKRGEGWLILVHVTANNDWSNLPISGLFVDMLRRIIGLSQGIVGDAAGAVFPPLEALDGFGRLGQPPATAAPIEGSAFATVTVGPASPPGFYGRAGVRRALNVSAGAPELKTLGDLPDGVARGFYQGASEIDLKPWLLTAALLLLLADLIIGYALRGLMSNALGRSSTTASLVLAGLIFDGPALAQSGQPEIRGKVLESDRSALEATLKTRLAYVKTGIGAVDSISRDGLTGLTKMLSRRTSVEAGPPLAVDLERQELAFFPLLYWPISPRQPGLSREAFGRLNTYLRKGGTILFDTREQGRVGFDALGRGGPAALMLRRILGRLDVPALTTLPRDHVLTKSFYLLNEFPGRWPGGTVWVERRGGRHNDGVSSIVIGSNDWAGAWALDKTGRPMFAVVPGGEPQRERAYRFGINWVMYALTGNYKADQVHVPAIIERLGQ